MHLETYLRTAPAVEHNDGLVWGRTQLTQQITNVNGRLTCVRMQPHRGCRPLLPSASPLPTGTCSNGRSGLFVAFPPSKAPLLHTIVHEWRSSATSVHDELLWYEREENITQANDSPSSWKSANLPSSSSGTVNTKFSHIQEVR